MSVIIHCESKKGATLTINDGYNFVNNSWSICKIIS